MYYTCARHDDNHTARVTCIVDEIADYGVHSECASCTDVTTLSILTPPETRRSRLMTRNICIWHVTLYPYPPFPHFPFARQREQ